MGRRVVEIGERAAGGCFGVAGEEEAAGGERVAVFRHQGKINAVSNVCQHQNGPLGEGQVVDIKWKGDLYRVQIKAITRGKVTTKTLGIKRGKPQPKRRPVSPRDPFWPVGYQAWEIVAG